MCLAFIDRSLWSDGSHLGGIGKCCGRAEKILTGPQGLGLAGNSQTCPQHSPIGSVLNALEKDGKLCRSVPRLHFPGAPPREFEKALQFAAWARRIDKA